MEDSKVHTKMTLGQQVQNKCNATHKNVKLFKDRFQPLIQKGLPYFWDEDGILLTPQVYEEQLQNCRNNVQKIEDMEGALKGGTMVEKLSSNFQL